jgi:GEVED domain-containing protein/dockerin type I repeat protein/parallel beta helix pectate lyase-like protein
LLGTISDRDKNGDDNRRLGFEVHGTIEFDNPTDVDVYSFNADPGTEVWIDIDRTSFSLDAMVELIDANGTVLARSLDEGTLSGSALPFNKDPYYGRDTFTTNPRDPVMRVVLPAPPGGGTGTPYFIRVRSQPPAGDLDNTAAGQTSGSYQMQIRLRQQDEEPGSTIRLSDIRFATIGIEVHGLPYHSPLLGESAEGDSAGNNTFGGAQPLGNLLTSDRNVISVGGDLTGLTDVDWYQFTLDVDLVQVIGGRSDSAKTWATMFDIDYADGLTRADLNLSVFDDQGRLIYVGRESNIQDDLPAPGQGLDTDDLSRGSFGPRDPYIGSVQLPAGSVGAGVSRTYFVAVSANRRLPDALNATFQAGASSPLIRLEPVNSVFRPVEDHIGAPAGVRGTSEPPGTNAIFGGTDLTLDAQVAPFNLSDVNLYVATQGGVSGNALHVVDPRSGNLEFTVGGLPVDIGDIVFRSDVHLYAEQGLPGAANTVGRLLELNFNTAGASVIGNDGIPDFNAGTNPPDPFQLTSDIVDAMAIRGNAVNNDYQVFIAARAGGISKLYEIDRNSGGFLRTTTGLINSGGITTGMAFVGNSLFGVNNNGDLYRIGFGGGVVPIATIPGGPNFAGLARGPINVENQAYRDLLFAITTGGRLYCFDTSGALQTVFDTNNDGTPDATNISTGVGGAVGLAFSPLDENLWHVSGRRGGDAGHGLIPTPDNSRGATEGVDGGSSMYFGFDGAGQRNYDNHPNNRDIGTNPQIAGTYNAPGGSYGYLTSNPFSLAGSVSADKPTLYFNYFLATDGVDGGARDAARVHVSTNGGATWQLAATNNSIRDTPITGAREGELPPFWSDSITDMPSNTYQRSQELFDNTGVWRQARVDLSNFAGQSNIRLRISFATSGDARGGTDEEAQFGSLNSGGRNQANGNEGFLIDDFIVGYAERGEMASGGSLGLTSFFTSPSATSDDAFTPPPGELNTGAYQLEMRRGLEYGRNRTGDKPEINLYDTFLTNDRLHPDFRAPINGIGTRDGRGDLNFIRQQGSVKIEQNIITNVSEVGIVVDNGVRGAGGSLTFPGAVRNVPTLNNERLFPGVVVSNNVIAEFGQAGIRFGGDTRPGGLTVAGVPFGRLMNNTIYGGAGARGVGIDITDNASPTIMNNILANTATAIAIDASSQAAGTVVGANLFANNGANGTTGTNSIQLAPNDPLFVNPSRRNFYLEDNSLAIDSALNSLSDRPSLLAVKSPLGIQPSPMLAPDRDVLGQLRVDDPTQDPPPGLGANVFKDRGAVERADFVGPSAILRVPIDNDPQGVDQDARETFVIIDSTLLDRFVVKLLDQGGVGIDDLLVSGARFLLTKDGVPLVQGLDYAFVYDNNADEVLFLPSSGVWDYRRLYVLTIDNSTATGILDLAGNALRPNQADGSTRFTIFVGAPIDFGDAPDDPANPNDFPTLEVSNGAGHKFKPSIYLGTGVNPDIVPLPTPNADGDTLDDGLISNSFRLNSATGQMVVSASVAGKLDAWLDLNQDNDWNDAGEYIVSSATPLGQLVPGNNTLNLTLPDGGRGASFLRLRFSTAGINSPTGIAEDGEVEDHKVLLLGPPFQNPINNLDVNNDGRVSPVDALLVLNANNRFTALHINENPRPPFVLPDPVLAPSAPPFLDVDGNNLCQAIDALRVINFLNASAGPQGDGRLGFRHAAGAVRLLQHRGGVQERGWCDVQPQHD